MTRLLRHDQPVPRGSDGAIHHSDSIEECRRKFDDVLRNGHLKIGYQLWQKEEEPSKDFNVASILTLPDTSCTFEQFKDIQEKMLLILHWRQCAHLPRREREWVAFHNKTWINSRRKKPQVRKTSGILHYSEPDGWRIWHGATPCDLTKPRIAPYKNTRKRLETTVLWCNLKFAQEKGLQFYQTRSHAVVLYNTLPAVCNEKAVCMKQRMSSTRRFA